MDVFFSYRFPKGRGAGGTAAPPGEVTEESFVRRVSYYLQSQSPLRPYCYADDAKTGAWSAQLADELARCDAFVLFAGEAFGETQAREAREAHARNAQANLGGDKKKFELLVVQLGGAVAWPDGPDGAWSQSFRPLDPIVLTRVGSADPPRVDEGAAQRVAREICFRLGKGAAWRPDLGVPMDHPFAYEKDIIKEFVEGAGRLGAHRLEQGCPECWPAVEKKEDFYDNPVPEEKIGKYGGGESGVLVDVRYGGGAGRPGAADVLTFSPARPRPRLRLPDPSRLAQSGNYLRAGVVVSGGIAPGINSVIAGIVERHSLYQQHYADQHGRGRLLQGYNLEILGYENGFRSLGRRPPTTVHLSSDVTKRLVRGRRAGAAPFWAPRGSTNSSARPTPRSGRMGSAGWQRTSATTASTSST